MLVTEPNKVRQKLNAGQCVMGTAIMSFSPNIVEAAGYAGLDFLRIDTEHAWRRDDSVDNMVRSALIADVCPIIRVDRDDPYLVRKALEVGGGGVIVPDVHTVEEAEAVVRASKFPPRGTRGFSQACTSGAWGGRPGDEWKRWSDSEPLIGVMIENVKALDQIDGILAVEGLDFVLFGPADYSMSLGLAGPNTKHPDVEAGLKRTIEAARKSGKHVMFGVGMADDDIRTYADWGVTMFEFGNDTAIVRGALANKVKTFGDRKVK
jgi:4-hydroxy-2-oxoheptanedioate aldolase